jgi:hypothetical protein
MENDKLPEGAKADPRRIGRLERWLASGSPAVFVIYAVTAAFSTYFCMYALRKPFAAADFEGWHFIVPGVDFKTGMVISQIIGYALSKFIGIKVCSEVGRGRRAILLVALVLVAQLALVLFGLLPGSWKSLAIFLNGVPLGMVWGLVVLYLEGRRRSELLLAGLSCSYILASGVVKDVGRAFLAHGVAEDWMPAVTGLCFLPLLVLSVWMLDQVPRPSAADVAARTQRKPMMHERRIEFAQRFLIGLGALLVFYFFLTAYRDFRDNYAVEILKELGYSEGKALLTKTEFPIAFTVLGALALLVLVKDNRRGLIGAFSIMILGTLLMGGATLLLDAGHITGLWWMILVGLGTYLAYVPFGSVLFDRLMASTHSVGTAVFAIYVMDAVGYTGSIGVQLYKDLAHSEATRFEFFHELTMFISVLGTLALIVSCLFFLRAPSGPSEQ